MRGRDITLQGNGEPRLNIQVISTLGSQGLHLLQTGEADYAGRSVNGKALFPMHQGSDRSFLHHSGLPTHCCGRQQAWFMSVTLYVPINQAA